MCCLLPSLIRSAGRADPRLNGGNFREAGRRGTRIARNNRKQEIYNGTGRTSVTVLWLCNPFLRRRSPDRPWLAVTEKSRLAAAVIKRPGSHFRLRAQLSPSHFSF